MIKVAVDVMSGDYGLPVTIPASLNVLKSHPDLELILVGDPTLIRKKLADRGFQNLPERLHIHPATEVVAMDELPSHSLKRKKDSSMRVAINLVKEQQALACVSAGNTGALMATARFVLKTLPGIERPAIITAFPTVQPAKITRVLDLGANVDSSVEHLAQFALMGLVLSCEADKLSRPTIGLLNIGAEEIKGNEQVRQTAKLLMEQFPENYAGYVEANDIFSGKVDVVVCDGFVGNVFLKSSEGAARLILHYLKKEFYRTILTKLMAFMVYPILKRVKKSIEPGNYNGACFIGLKGVVIKSHGNAQEHAFGNAILEAKKQAEQNIPEKIATQLANLASVGHQTQGV